MGFSLVGDLLGTGVGGTGVGATYGAGDGGKTGVLIGTGPGTELTSIGDWTAPPVAKLTHKLMLSSYAPSHLPFTTLPIPKIGSDVIRISLPEALFFPSKENFTDLSLLEAFRFAHSK